MQPDEFFAVEWPTLVPEVRAALARAGAPVTDRADLVQETAVRLLGMWDRIDWDRPVGPLAHRIALNAWRDQWRRRGAREVVGAVPEQTAANDTERCALARVHVGEVARALADLPPSTARVLRVAAVEAESAAPVAAAPAALRMARSRARRALAATLQIASAVAAAVGIGVRAFGRSGRTATASLGVLATVAFVLGSGGWLNSRPAPRASQPNIALAIAAGATDAAPHVAKLTAGGSSGSSVLAVKPVRHKHAAPAAPYYYVGNDTAKVGVFMDVSAQGYEVKIARPEAGTKTPVCAGGNTPTINPLPRCPH
jgi:DNA-directed RNA polymerase specialized sigma24 family protein